MIFGLQSSSKMRAIIQSFDVSLMVEAESYETLCNTKLSFGFSNENQLGSGNYMRRLMVVLREFQNDQVN